MILCENIVQTSYHLNYLVFLHNMCLLLAYDSRLLFWLRAPFVCIHSENKLENDFFFCRLVFACDICIERRVWGASTWEGMAHIYVAREATL